MNPLPWLLAQITFSARYEPEIVWSDKSFVHNAFRLYEKVFWRRVGIRRELSSLGWQDIDGNKYITYACHSFESFCALVETYIRQTFSKFKFIPVRIFIPILRTTAGFPIPTSPFLLAIAVDTSDAVASQTNTSVSFSHTVTGSNMILITVFGQFTTSATDFVTGIQYNSVTMTAVAGTPVTGSIPVNVGYMYYLLAPTTGANNVVISSSASKEYRYTAVSYSGVAQSGQPDSSGTNTLAATITDTITVSSTVIASNCWVVSMTTSNNDFTGVMTVSGAVTGRQNLNFVCLADSNGTVTTGSKSSTFTSNNGPPPADSYATIQISIAPFIATATAIVIPTLSFMHAG